MSTLDINAIRDYLLKVGCKIEYPILVNAFKQHLYNKDPNVQGLIRTQFKDYVNRLAIVSLENNMKFIILRPEFRPKEPQIERQPSAVRLPTDNVQASPMAQPNMLKQSTILSSPPQHSPVARQKHQQPPPLPPPVPQHHRHIDNLPQNILQSPLSNPQLRPIMPLPVVQTKSSPQQQLPNNYQQHLTTQRIPPIQQSAYQMKDKQLPLDVSDSSLQMPPPQTATTPTKRSQLMQRPEFLNLSSATQMPPPRPPPRRRQSTASLFKPSPKPAEKSREIHDLAKKSQGRVKEHALKLNSFNSLSNLNASVPMRSNTMKENRLSRDSTIGSLSSTLQRNGSHLTTRSRSSHREDESDSSSLQPIDPLRRKWAIEACNCNYTGLVNLLREDTKLASYKDIVNGYTALHWAAKFGNLNIIKLIAGLHGVSTNIKSSAGYTPLHVAYMFNRNEAADLLLNSYKANPNIRDHSGKRPMQYWNHNKPSK